jgi:hypothetical protein
MMPFRDYSGFDPAALDGMTKAYDSAVAKLDMQSTDPRTSKLAALIVSLVSTGERDPDKLCEGAVAQLLAK